MKIPSDDTEAPPPFLGRWRNVYVALLVQLGVLIAVFYAVARWAS